MTRSQLTPFSWGLALYHVIHGRFHHPLTWARRRAPSQADHSQEEYSI